MRRTTPIKLLRQLVVQFCQRKSSQDPQVRPSVSPWLQALEPRLLLSTTVASLSSDLPDMRFIAGADLPAVVNTYRAIVTGSPSSVAFQIGNQQVVDDEPSDGWAASFNMTSLTGGSQLVATPYEGVVAGTGKAKNLNLTPLPTWLTGDDVELSWNQFFDSSSGYSFSVFVKSLSQGFIIPNTSDWAWTPPAFTEPLVDFRNMWTGFDAGFKFDILSSPAGSVSTANAGLMLRATVLDTTIWDSMFPAGSSNNLQIPTPLGIASGSYSVQLGPQVSNDLRLTGVQATAQLDIGIDKEWTLFDRSVPIGPNVPFVASVAELGFVATASVHVGFDGSLSGSLTTDGRLGVQAASLRPDATVSLTGSAEARLGNLGPFTFAKAGVALTGTLDQDFRADYQAGQGWSYEAPGSLALSGSLAWDTVFGLFGGGRDLFSRTIAEWDFIIPGPGDPPADTTPARSVEGPPLVAIAGSHLAYAQDQWEDPDSDNQNGVPEAGEPVRLKIAITNNSGSPLSNVEAILGSEDESVLITSRRKQYPDIAQGASASPYGWFEMTLPNFADDTHFNFNLHVSYQKDGQYYYQNIPYAKILTPPRTPGFQLDIDSIVWQDSGSDGVLHSGEDATFTVSVTNNASVPAQNVRVLFDNVSEPGVTLSLDEVNYGDFAPGQTKNTPDGRRFVINPAVPGSFAGTVTADMVVTYGNDPVPLRYPGALEFEVVPVTYIAVDPRQRNIGIVSPGETVIVPDGRITNVGTGWLTVSGFTVPVGVQIHDISLPAAVAPGESTTFTIEIDVPEDQGSFAREIVVNSDGRSDGNSNLIQISGMATDLSPTYTVPGSNTNSQPDVGGNVVVWRQSGIQAYDIATGVTEIVNESGSRPFTDGTWVAWEDAPDGQEDIFAKRLGDETVFAIEGSSAKATLLGVDNGRIVYMKADFTFDRNGNQEDVWNVYYAEPGVGSTQVTSYGQPVPGQSAVSASSQEGDVDAGLITWARSVYTWNGATWGATGTSRSIAIYEVDRDASEIVVDDSSSVLRPRTGDGAVAYAKSDGGTSQFVIWVWDRQTGAREIWREQSGISLSTPVVDDGIVVAVKSTGGMYWRAVSTGEVFAAAMEDPINGYLRLRGNLLVWRFGNTIRYSYLRHSDLSVGGIAIAGEPTPDVESTLIVTVQNAVNVAATEGVTLRLFDGEVEIASQEVGILAGSQSEGHAFQVALGVGSHQLRAVIDPVQGDNPGNDSYEVSIVVQAPNFGPPEISQFQVEELDDDGSGKIGSDEGIRLGVVVADEDGVGDVAVSVDGGEPIAMALVDGRYEASFPAASAGRHEVTIFASDVREPALSSQQSSWFNVVAAEQASLWFNGQRVTEGGTIAVGTFIEGDPATPIPFVIRNEGDEPLMIETVGVTGEHDVSQVPQPMVASAPDFTWFTFTPSTSSAGPISAIVSVTNSSTVSPWTFTVNGTVGQAQSSQPTGVHLLPESDTGWLSSDAVTRLDNADLTRALKFTVEGTVAGSVVSVYAEDGLLIGSATGTAGSTTVTTNGTAALSHGTHDITARQVEAGKLESVDSPSLTLQVDTVPPSVAIQAAPVQPDPWAVRFLVQFNDDVTGVAAEEFVIGGTAQPSERDVTGSGSDYALTVRGMTRSGTVTAAVVAAAGMDVAGNMSTAAGPVARPYNPPSAPDLTGALVATRLPGVAVPGDRGTVTVSITNDGMGNAAGTLAVNVVLRPAQGGEDILVGEIPALRLNLPAGRSRNVNVPVRIGRDVLSGDYQIVAFIDAEDAIAEDNSQGDAEANNEAELTAGGQPIQETIVWQFGQVNQRRNVRLDLSADGAGGIFALTGVGTGEVSDGGDGTFDVLVLESTSRSSVRVTSPPRSLTRVQLGSVSIDSPLNIFDARTSELNGDFVAADALGQLNFFGTSGEQLVVSIGGSLGSITTGEARSVSFEVEGAIRSMRLVNGENVQVTAASLGTLQVTGARNGVAGNFTGQIDLTDGAVPRSLTSLVIAGQLGDDGADYTRIISAGSIGAITAGSIVKTHIFAGALNTQTFAEALDDVDQVQKAQIASLAIKNTASDFSFVDSLVEAYSIGRVTLKRVQPANPEPFGVAVESVKAFSYLRSDGTVRRASAEELRNGLVDDEFELRLLL